LIDAEATARVGAERFERTATRTTQRNGMRDRLLSTNAGDVDLKIPKCARGVSFPASSTDAAASTTPSAAVDAVMGELRGSAAESLDEESWRRRDTVPAHGARWREPLSERSDGCGSRNRCGIH